MLVEYTAVRPNLFLNISRRITCTLIDIGSLLGSYSNLGNPPSSSRHAMEPAADDEQAVRDD